MKKKNVKKTRPMAKGNDFSKGPDEGSLTSKALEGAADFRKPFPEIVKFTNKGDTIN